MQWGYSCSSEEFEAGELVRLGRRAEEAGFDFVTVSDPCADEAVHLAGSLEDASEHPIAKAIAAGARAHAPALSPVESFANAEGLGVQGVVDGHAVVAGRERFLTEWSLHLDDTLTAARDAAQASGRTPIFVGWDGQARAVLVVSDTVKPTSSVASNGRGASSRWWATT